ncbi:cupin domain-containing protein [Paenibacillus glycinis]|uniref:Cupin domain-containing protein n=1 Tax=Paenibacillus glycinis TaxID=2697035 RepID=A0ABW9XQ56_9BACL|nr:cupin domain-containing protein [Paenibacillus glycinis]NBD24507.1 cupin domain-containing protein [Paenibacillus glycinis]
MPRFDEWHASGPGIERKIFPPGETIMSMMVTLKTGSVGTAHSHPHEQLTFVVSGRLQLEMNGAITVAEAGEQFFIPGDAVHEVTALADTVVVETFTPLRADLLATITE